MQLGKVVSDSLLFKVSAQQYRKVNTGAPPGAVQLFLIINFIQCSRGLFPAREQLKLT